MQGDQACERYKTIVARTFNMNLFMESKQRRLTDKGAWFKYTQAGWQGRTASVFHSRRFESRYVWHIISRVYCKVHACYNSFTGAIQTALQIQTSVYIMPNMKRISTYATANREHMQPQTGRIATNTNVEQGHYQATEGWNTASFKHLTPSSSRAWSHLWTGNAFVKMSAACSSVGT